jgi:hydrogenase expression/formation protein HypE
MLVRQLRDGRCEVENQYTRVVRRDGNPRALACSPRRWSCATRSSGAGSAGSTQSALKLRPSSPPGTPRRASSCRARRVADPKACQCGEVLIGAIKPWECKVFGTAVHARAPDRHLHGLERGRVRRLLQLRRAAREAPSASRRDAGGAGPKLRDELVTLAHGAGGKATRASSKGCSSRSSATRCSRRSATRRCSSSNGSRLAFTTDSYVVKPLFFPGGDIGELAVNGTVNDLAVCRRAAARALGRLRDRGRFPRRRPAPDRGVDGARRSGAAGVPVAPATRRSSSAARPTALYVTTAGIGVVDPGVELGPERVARRPRARLGDDRRPRDGRHAVARGELELEVDLESDTAPCTSSHGAARARAALRFMRDPTRGGLATALNELARPAGVASTLDETALPVRPAVVGPARSSASTRSTSRTRASSSPSSPPRPDDAALARCARIRSAPGRDRRRRCAPIPRGFVLIDTVLGGSRIVDMLVGDPLPRIC